jgi:CheY-like chemotaxis protein
VVELVAAAGLRNVHVDRNQLENALLHLCINARDVMPYGGRLTMQTANQWFDEHMAAEHDLPAGQYVSLRVGDNGADAIGCGCPCLRSVLYHEAAGRGDRPGPLHGLRICAAIRGQARIYSEPGKGTRVYLYLPRQLGAEVPEEQPSELARTPSAGESATVLLVDDEELVRMLVTRCWRTRGISQLRRPTPLPPLGLLQSNRRIDLLITDVGLPGGMNGCQLAEAARALQRDLKVLFILGYAENTVLDYGALDPGMHLMTKPFAIEALARLINDIIAAPVGARRRETAHISQS